MEWPLTRPFGIGFNYPFKSPKEKMQAQVPQAFVEKFNGFDSPVSDIVVNVPELTITIRYISTVENPCPYITSYILVNLFEQISNNSTFDYKFTPDQVDFYKRLQKRKFFKKPNSQKFMFVIFYNPHEIILRCPGISASNSLNNFLKDVNDLLLNHPYKLV